MFICLFCFSNNAVGALCLFDFVLFCFSNKAVGVACLFVYVFVCFIFSNKAVGVLLCSPAATTAIAVPSQHLRCEGYFDKYYNIELILSAPKDRLCEGYFDKYYNIELILAAPKDRLCEGYSDKYYNIELVLWDLRKGKSVFLPIVRLICYFCGQYPCLH